MSPAVPDLGASRRTVLAGGLAAFACAPSLASRVATYDHLGGCVDRVMVPLIAKYRVPGLVVGVTEAGQRRFYAYGVTSLESKHPVDAFTRFEIGSVSKVFTSLLAALAVAEGRLHWSDPVLLHLPRLKDSALGDATLEQLATYTAGGLPLQFPDTVSSWDAAWKFYQGWIPTSAPGSLRLYSNPSMGLLGAATAAVFRSEFAVLMKERVFAPLDLSHSFMQWPEQETQSFAWGYDALDNPIRATIAPSSAEAYGVKTSADDLLALLEALMDPGRIIGKAHRTALRDTIKPRFLTSAFAQCLGWERYDAPVALPQLLEGNGREMILESQPVTALSDSFSADQHETGFLSKTGSTNGFGAYAAFVPERRLGIVMLANRNFPNAERVKVAHAILELPGGSQRHRLRLQQRDL